MAVSVPGPGDRKKVWGAGSQLRLEQATNGVRNQTQRPVPMKKLQAPGHVATTWAGWPCSASGLHNLPQFRKFPGRLRLRGQWGVSGEVKSRPLEIEVSA